MKEIIDNWLISFLTKLKLTEYTVSVTIEIVYLLAILLLNFLAYFLFKYIVVKIIKRIFPSKKIGFNSELLGSKTIPRFLSILPGIMLYSLSYLMPILGKFIKLLSSIYITVIIVAAIFSFLDVINLVYEKKHANSGQKSIRGLLRIVKSVAFTLALIIIISQIIGESPVYIISGLGALSAILLLVFKDSILGMVAGVQMESNDIVRIGDWIEMPKYGADGSVIQISLTIVKVKNWDNTITTIPTYALVSDSFKNWRGMFASGGRRIKRALYIDVTSISFCSEELLQQLSKVEYLKDYLKSRQQEIKEFNEKNSIDTSIPVNGRRLTNIGVFRKYATEYLKNHPKIHKEMIHMVRQLHSGKDGVPLEIYAFTNDTAWVNYEGIMSDIFDHLFAVLPFFNLKIFQEPSGSDIKSLK